MKIEPTLKDFRVWIKCVPVSGDLIFLKKPHTKLPSRKIYKSSSGKPTEDNIWSLNSRSWYGYARGRSHYYAWLPPGGIESLPDDVLKEVAGTQISLNVPTLIKANKLSKRIFRKFPHIGTYAWVTALSWEKLSHNEKVSVMAAWFSQNEIVCQETVPLPEIPTEVRKRIKGCKFQKILNTFRTESGGNCFAAASAFVTKDTAFLEKWVFWPELKNLLKKSGFRNIHSYKALHYGDVLMFRINGKPVHAAIYFGAGIYFEKAGQDFYEPYRTVYFKNWKKEWPKATLTIFRK